MTNKKSTYKADEPIHFKGSLDENIKLKDNFPFSIPDGYFDELPDEISDRINVVNQPPLISVFLKRCLQPVIYVPSFIIVIAIVYASVLFFNSGSNEYEQFSELTLEEILVEIPYFYENVEEAEILSILLADYDEYALELYQKNNGIESLSNDDLIEYLLYDDINNELLIDF